MRYTRIGNASYAIGTVLVLVAVGVAWARSHAGPGLAPGPEEALTPEAGAAVYARECSGCHGAGEARGGSVPALRGGALDILRSADGREYLIDFVLDGRVRRAEGGNTTYADAHPGYPRLGDAEVAAVLNHVLVSWGNDALLPPGTALYTASEVAARRTR